MSLKKTTIIIVLVCIVSINAFVLVPRIHAQWVVSAPALEGMEVRQWIMNELQGLWRGALSQTVFNSLNYFLQKLAYDAAIWVSSGGQGQGPLFEYKDFGSYISDVALDTAASAIDELSDGWPVDLCSPSLDFLPEVSMSIQLGVVQTYEPRPRCSWNELSANWDQFIAENSSGEVLAEYARSIRPGEGGLGSILALHEKIATEQAKKSQGAIEARREGGGIKPVVGVSGYIESPVTLVEEELRNRFVRAPQRGTEQSVENVLASADSWISMGLNVGSLFLNTLTSNLFSNIMEGMFDTGELISERGSLWDLGGSGTEPSGGRIAAEEIFADLLTPSILEVTNYSPLSEFTTCPNERGSQNCVMDASFAAALSQSAGGNTITVKDALQKGYLRGNWPLIPLEDKSRNQDPNCYTYGYCYSNLVKLRKARIIPIGWELAANSMANDIGNPITLGEVVNGFDDCGSDTTDPSPWCHLINPNWILKFPITQCKLKVSGSRLASAEGDLRESMCVDTPSCIEEDNDGKCLGAWGYCTREKNIWRMTADTCSAEYSSCETLTNREGKKVSYLKNTLDYDNCNVGNVGCKWYSRSKTGDSWNPADRIYLNKNVEMCDASFAGCSDLIRKGSGVSKNYIKNSSFEIDEDGDDLPDEWSWRGIGASAYSVDGMQSYHQTDAVRAFLSGSGMLALPMLYYQDVYLAPGNYTFSAYAKQHLIDENARADIVIYGSTKQLNFNFSNTDCPVRNGLIELNATPGEFYERMDCSFSLNSSATVTIQLGSINSNGVWFDAIQLEEGTSATAYREEGYPFGLEFAHLKKSPEYLGCAGDILTDNSECFNYARVCTAEDIGCELYTPANGDPRIAAVTSLEDMCPAECAGYDLFRQGETNFESEEPVVFLIPRNSEVCSYDVAGCDEFTDTETEEKLYYSFLRQCSAEIGDGAIYYTWEGSDTAGYQLKSWSLVGAAGSPPTYQSGFTDYDLCTEDIFRAGTEPDCREFYDEVGNISYRLYSKTIVVTEDCKELRRTPTVSDLLQQEIDCRATGGRWGGENCFYHGYLLESDSCGAEYNGCRAYTGSAGRNVRILFNDTFEGGDISEWTESGAATISTESLQVGGHSLTGLGDEVGKHIDVKQGGIYTLSFWAKGPLANLAVVWSRIDHESPEHFSSIFSPRVTLANEWRLYNLGPVYLENPRVGGDVLEFIPRSITGAEVSMKNVYIDNIILKEVIENIYLIKDSSVIPTSCDMTIQGAYLPQAMVGCAEYKDRANITRYLKSFTKLCSEDVVGCEAFIDTKNTISPFEEVWNDDTGNSLDTLTIIDDETIYLVYDEQFSCDSSNVGCSKVGYPEIKRTETMAAGLSYQDQYLKINPAQLDSVLCKNEELFCEEYRTENSGALYAKDPRELLCEFREDDGQIGWFKKGTTDESCDERGNYNIWRNADPDYAGWVGECPEKESGCTTLVDVADKSSNDYPDGKPYFVIRNEKLDEKSCRGEVSRAEGCVLFDDLNDSSTNFRADSTYFKSRDEKGGGKVTAVSCPDSEDCKKCLWRQDTGTINHWYGHACGVDVDCADVMPPASEISTDLFGRPLGTIEISCVLPPTGDNQLQNDTNLIVKVTPDRVCGEWLACRSTATVYDETAGRNKKICTSVDLCREYQRTGEEESRCTKFVEGDGAGQILNLNNYVARDVSWGGMEYAGYSIPNQFQISDLEAIDLEEGVKRLVYKRDEGEYLSINGKPYVEGDTYLFGRDARRMFVERTCRAYPEKNSPFPHTVAEWNRYFDKETKGAMSMKKQGYTGAQVREKYVWLDGDADNKVDDGERELQTGECSYKKATYGRGTLTKYFDYDQEFLPEGLCFGGIRDGLPCVPYEEESCGPMEEGGVCERLTRADKYLGLEGYCVEYDYSVNINASREEYPCLTWRPVEIPEGGQDVYNQYDSAGYNPPSAGVGKYYCLMGKGNADSDSARYSFTSSRMSVTVASTPSDEYRELLRARQGGEPMFKEDIAAIILSLTDFDAGSPSSEEVSLFTQEDKNILSRKGKHNGEFIFNDVKYTYWEVRFPDTEDGIEDWDSGPATFGTAHPLFAAQSASASFLPGIDLTFTSMSDMSCAGGSEVATERNYTAIRAMFDDKDIFQGFWMVYCDNSDSDGTARFNIEFLKAEPCLFIVQTVGPDGENAARTNQIWEYKNALTKLDPVELIAYEDSDEENEADNYQYLYNQENPPFGSAANGFKNPEMSLEPWFVGADGKNGSPYFTTTYFSQGEVDAGSPLGCRSGERDILSGGISRMEGCYWGETSIPLTSEIDRARDELRKIFAKSYDVYTWHTGDSDRRSIVDENGRMAYDDDITSAERILGVDRRSVPVYWDDTEDIGTRVRIAAPDPGGAVNVRGMPIPVMPDRVTLNNQTSGIANGSKNFEATVRFYAWADKDQMPIKTRWVQWGDNTPVEKHFGKYKNQKPICASTPTEEIGYCVEIPGLTCLSSDDCPTGACTTQLVSRCAEDLSRSCLNDTSCRFDFGQCLRDDPMGPVRCSINHDIICPSGTIIGDTGPCQVYYGPCIEVVQDVEPSFGNSSDACEEGSFEFTHTYVCDEEVLGGLSECIVGGGGEWDGSSATAPFVWNVPCKIVGRLTEGREECVFRPTVRITDNWGWCSATTRATCGAEDLNISNEANFNGAIVISP